MMNISPTAYITVNQIEDIDYNRLILSENTEKIYSALGDILPTSQALRLTQEDSGDFGNTLKLFVFYDVIITAVCTAVGGALFIRRDLR